MQFTTFVYAAIVAATSISAHPNVKARQAEVVGIADIYANTGCTPLNIPTVPGFELTETAAGACNTFTAPSKAVNVTAINAGCTVKLFTNTACTSTSVITLPNPGEQGGGLNRCQEGNPGINGYTATCA